MYHRAVGVNRNFATVGTVMAQGLIHFTQWMIVFGCVEHPFNKPVALVTLMNLKSVEGKPARVAEWLLTGDSVGS